MFGRSNNFASASKHVNSALEFRVANSDDVNMRSHHCRRHKENDYYIDAMKIMITSRLTQKWNCNDSVEKSFLDCVWRSKTVNHDFTQTLHAFRNKVNENSDTLDSRVLKYFVNCLRSITVHLQ